MVNEERQEDAAHDLEDGALECDHHHAVGQQQDPPVLEEGGSPSSTKAMSLIVVRDKNGE